MSDFLEGLENSGWLKHIKAVLDAAIFIAKVSLGLIPAVCHTTALNIDLGVCLSVYVSVYGRQL